MDASVPFRRVEGRAEFGTVDRLSERRVTVPAKADDGLRPGRWVMGVARQIAPQDRAAFVGKLPREGIIYADKSILNELLKLRVA